MKTAIILHGTLGSPDINWFRWLTKELEERHFKVWLPELPNASKPSLSQWSKFVINNCPFNINEETLIIGHSSGAICSLVIAQDNIEPIGGVIAVSVLHDNSLNWEPNSRLFDVYFDWDVIKCQARKIIFVHSDNDPYVPLDQAQFVANNCNSELILIPKQGHFNLEFSSKYKKFPKLLELIDKNF